MLIILNILINFLKMNKFESKLQTSFPPHWQAPRQAPPRQVSSAESGLGLSQADANSSINVGIASASSNHGRTILHAQLEAGNTIHDSRDDHHQPVFLVPSHPQGDRLFNVRDALDAAGELQLKSDSARKQYLLDKLPRAPPLSRCSLGMGCCQHACFTSSTYCAEAGGAASTSIGDTQPEADDSDESEAENTAKDPEKRKRGQDLKAEAYGKYGTSFLLLLLSVLY